MGVGPVWWFRQVVSSFSFVLKRPAPLAFERQRQAMHSFSPPKTTSLGRLFEGDISEL